MTDPDASGPAPPGGGSRRRRLGAGSRSSPRGGRLARLRLHCGADRGPVTRAPVTCSRRASRGRRRTRGPGLAERPISVSALRQGGGHDARSRWRARRSRRPPGRGLTRPLTRQASSLSGTGCCEHCGSASTTIPARPHLQKSWIGHLRGAAMIEPCGSRRSWLRGVGAARGAAARPAWSPSWPQPESPAGQGPRSTAWSITPRARLPAAMAGAGRPSGAQRVARAPVPVFWAMMSSARSR